MSAIDYFSINNIEEFGEEVIMTEYDDYTHKDYARDKKKREEESKIPTEYYEKTNFQKFLTGLLENCIIDTTSVTCTPFSEASKSQLSRAKKACDTIELKTGIGTEELKYIIDSFLNGRKDEIPTIKDYENNQNFKKYQAVLTRTKDVDLWKKTFILRVRRQNVMFEPIQTWYVNMFYKEEKQCIPFEGNEHLLGTNKATQIIK